MKFIIKMERKMKKIVCVILILVLCLSSVSCSSPKEKEFNSAKEAYELLVESDQNCQAMLAAIYNAWHFYIYEGSDYKEEYAKNMFSDDVFNDALNDFCEQTGLIRSVVLSSVDQYLESSGEKTTDLNRLIIICGNYAMDIVILAYTNAGVCDDIEKAMNSAKESMKSLTLEYDNYTGYSILRSYYTEISSCFEFCESLNCSFNQLVTIKDNYETNLRKYKNELDFIFS